MLSDIEVAAQRAITAAFVDADRFSCTLTREERVPDGEGGYTTVISPVDAQWLRMVPLQDATQDRTDATGNVVTPGYMLVGRYSNDIQRGDTFLKEGRQYEVVFVLENQQYQVKGEVIYLG